MAKVKMLLDLDFVELQKIKKDVSLFISNDDRLEKEILIKLIGLIDAIQDQAIDNPQNSFTSKQVLGGL